MTITLEELQAQHSKLADMIAAFDAQRTAKRIIVSIPEAEIELHDGEQYAGIMLGQHGASYHLVLLPGEAEAITWESAKTWAAEVGGELPNRREQSLLHANLKDQFQRAWYWSGEQHAADSAYAWGQYFGYGDQLTNHKGGRLRARAVRRLVFSL